MLESLLKRLEFTLYKITELVKVFLNTEMIWFDLQGRSEFQITFPKRQC